MRANSRAGSYRVGAAKLDFSAIGGCAWYVSMMAIENAIIPVNTTAETGTISLAPILAAESPNLFMASTFQTAKSRLEQSASTWTQVALAL